MARNFGDTPREKYINESNAQKIDYYLGGGVNEYSCRNMERIDRGFLRPKVANYGWTPKNR